jgi:hypothetical protein
MAWDPAAAGTCADVAEYYSINAPKSSGKQGEPNLNFEK